jgi:ABC-type transport system substrate-binding protein
MVQDTEFQLEFADRLAHEVLMGRMTRRELLVRAGVVGLSATLVGQVLVACGGASPSTSTTAATATPKKGGTLVFAWDSEPQTIDPAIAWNIIDVQIIRAIFEGLYTYAAKPGEAGTQLVPNLAADMPSITNGGTTYTIPIRHGVMFQPPVSREVTANDFKYSFERMMRLPDAPGTYFYTNIVGATAYQAGKAAHVAGYKALDKYTIQVDLIKPDLAFTKSLMEFCDVVPSEWVQKLGNKQFGRHPLGTGPFLFQKWVPGQQIVLARNPNYRDAAHVWLDGIKFGLSDNAQSALLMLQLGHVDVLGNNVPPGSAVSVMNSAEWRPYVYREPVIGTIYMFLNGQFPPLDNVMVRQAISWAIDRDRLVKLQSGQAQALYQVYPPGMPGYQADKKWYGYDPQKAKQLLAQAGHANGFKTTLYTDNVDPYPKLFQSIQNDLAQVGIVADLKITSNATFFTLSSTANKCAMGRDLWYMDYPDPSDWIISLFTKAAAVTGAQDNAFWWSPVIENMVQRAQAMTDPQARLALYEQMQAYIMSQAPYVTLYSPVMTTMCSKRVGGFYLHEVFNYDPVHYWIN